MKVREVMLQPVVCVEPGQSVASAARVLHHYNIGAVPVCTAEGRLCGILTDRDVTVRCVAAGRSALCTQVGEIMTKDVISIDPEMEVSAAAHLMGRKRVRRLPVVRSGQLSGMVSLDVLAADEQNAYDAADALGEISAFFLENSY